MTNELRRSRCAAAAATALALMGCSGRSTRGDGPGGGTAGLGGSGGDGGTNAASGGASGLGASGGTSGSGGSAGAGATDGDAGEAANGGGGGGEIGGNAGSGGIAAGGTVDSLGNCPNGLDYFISMEGDLPSRRLTRSCEEDVMNASVPVYDPALSLEPSDQRFHAFVGCEGDERLEVWPVAYPNEDSASGFYMAADGTTYSVCDTTSRAKVLNKDCLPKLGTVTYAKSTSSKAVLEGRYEMVVYDEAGAAYTISGEFRVCAYLQ